MKDLSIAITIILAAVVTSKKKCGPLFEPCGTDAFCHAIPPSDEEDVFIRCKQSEEGNEMSPRICIIGYVADENKTPSPVVRSPNEKRCKVTNGKKATDACLTYIRTHSPYTGYVNGKKYIHCATAVTPYYCSVGPKKFITCAIAKVNCDSSCPVMPGEVDDNNTTAT